MCWESVDAMQVGRNGLDMLYENAFRSMLQSAMNPIVSPAKVEWSCCRLSPLPMWVDGQGSTWRLRARSEHLREELSTELARRWQSSV